MASPLQPPELFGGLHFEENAGQRPQTARFIARGPGFTLALHSAEVQLALGRTKAAGQGSHVLIQMRLKGASEAAELRAESPLPGRVNHFVGSDPSRWRTNLATYARVRYAQVYPGIDLVYHGQQGELEYDFVVVPGADPSLIRMEFSGLDELQLSESGDLLLHTAAGTVRQRRPILYQETTSSRTPIEGRFVLQADGTVGFDVGSYDLSLPLVIDPILVYSTYLGSGELAGQQEWVNDIAVDPSGYVYVTGSTWSLPDFPFANPAQTQDSPRIGASGGANAFVARFRPDGQLLYATYLGGEKDDVGNAIAVDLANNTYITGRTHSAPNLANQRPNLETDGFPTTPGAFGTDYKSSHEINHVAFLTKLNSAGQIVRSTFAWVYLRDNRDDCFEGVAVAVDSQARPTILLSGCEGGGLLQLDPNLALALRTSRLGEVRGRDLAIDAQDNLHLVGSTGSLPLITPINSFWTEFFQSRLVGGFYQKYDSAGAVVYAAVFPGGGASSVAVDSAGHAYVVGNTLQTLTTSSPPYGANRWPVKDAFQTTNRGAYDGFIFKIDPTKSGADSLLYASFLGGTDSEEVLSVDVDEVNRIYVTGTTSSTNFPLASPLQNSLAGPSDAFVAQLNSAGSGLIFSSYWGGTGVDRGHGVAIGLAATDLYFAGETRSTNFPVKSPVQSSRLGTSDGFVTRIQLTEPAQTFVVNSENDIDDGNCDSAHCSLREAIAAANSIPGRQTIRFTANVKQIRPLSALPPVTEPVVIEQEVANPERPFINGAEAGMADGLVIRSHDTEMRRLVIANFQGYGLRLEDGGANRVEACSIGRGADGSGPNLKGGILILRSHANVIGSAQLGLGCMIAGNGGNGIHISESTDTKVLGSLIGGKVGSPTQVYGNAENGILIEYSTRTLIGDRTLVPGEGAGNAISANGQAGIRIAGFVVGDRANTVRGNLIGSGGSEPGNNIGVLIETFHNLVGGPDAGDRNLISGNIVSGVEIRGEHGLENEIQGNWIGLSQDGTMTNANGKHGVLLSGASNNQIGGETTQPGLPPGNIISENGPAGFGDRGEITTANVKIEGGAGNELAGNLIGPVANGSDLRRGNQNAGVLLLDSSDTIIGGDTEAARNLISGNGAHGIFSRGGRRTRIVGNWLGLDLSGSGPMSNRAGAITLKDGFDEVIGGSTPSPGTAPGNVVATLGEIHSSSSGCIDIYGANGAVIRGNLIGTDATGTKSFHVADYFPFGIRLSESSWVLGGASPSDRNVISGNYEGVRANLGPSRNRIVGNFIGTDISGTMALPNRGPGIHLPFDLAAVQIGGLEAGEENIIAYNGQDGIYAEDRYGLGRLELSRNLIFENGGVGIRDGGDLDWEPLVELLQARLVGGAVVVEGLAPESGGVARIELFASPACDPSGFGEGKTFFHAVNVATSATEKMRFVAIIDQPLLLGAVLTATATFPPNAQGYGGGTTRFSRCRVVQDASGADADGVPDFIEERAPNSGDGNGDGIKDQVQPNVCTVQTWQPPYPTCTIESPPETILEDIEAPPDCEFNGDAGGGLLLPHGCLEFTVEPAPLFSPIELKIFLPAGSPVNRYFVLSSTPPIPEPHWFNFEWDGSTGARFESGLARVSFIDGGRGDSDGTANGRIVTKGALVFEGSVPFRFDEPTLLPLDQILLSGQVSAGTRVVFEKSADLRDWTPFKTLQVGTGYFRLIDNVPPEAASGFYRARR